MRNIIFLTCVLLLLISNYAFALPSTCTGGMMGKGGCGQMPPSWAKKGDAPMRNIDVNSEIAEEVEAEESSEEVEKDLSSEKAEKALIAPKGFAVNKPDTNSSQASELKNLLNSAKRNNKLIEKFNTTVKSSLNKKNSFIHIEYPKRDKKYNNTHIAFQDPKTKQIYVVMNKAGSSAINIHQDEMKKMKGSDYVIFVWHTNPKTKERSKDLIGHLKF